MSYEQYRNVMDSFGEGSGRRREAERERMSDLTSRFDNTDDIRNKLRERLNAKKKETQDKFTEKLQEGTNKLMKDIGIADKVRERTAALGTAVNTAYPGVVAVGRSADKIATRLAKRSQLRAKVEGAKNDVGRARTTQSVADETAPRESAMTNEPNEVEMTDLGRESFEPSEVTTEGRLPVRPARPTNLDGGDRSLDADEMLGGQDTSELAERAGGRVAETAGEEAATGIGEGVGEAAAEGAAEGAGGEIAAGLGVAELIPGVDVLAGLALAGYEVGNFFHAWGKADNFGQGDDAEKQVKKDESAPPPVVQPMKQDKGRGVVEPSQTASGRVSALAGSSGVSSVVSSALR